MRLKIKWRQSTAGPPLRGLSASTGPSLLLGGDGLQVGVGEAEVGAAGDKEFLEIERSNGEAGFGQGGSGAWYGH